MTIQLGELDPVPPRSVWPHEGRRFTPWLAQNLRQLSDAVDLDLELVEIEHEFSNGRKVDILARAGNNHVVIENQLEISDHDHFVRLLYYGKAAGATTFIWVAPEFDDLHTEIVLWLNSAHRLDIRCVEVSAWQHDDNYASMSRQRFPAPIDGGDSRGYRAFYRPLQRRLAAAGFTQVQPVFETEPVCRWFATPVPDILYGLLYGDVEGNSWAFILFDDEEGEEPDYVAVASRRKAILAHLSEDVESGHDPSGSFWVSFKTPASLNDAYELQPPIRDWMFDRLTELQQAAAGLFPQP